jgi:hypothetical protein
MSSFVCCAYHLHNVLLVTHSVSIACKVLGDAELLLLFLKANRFSVYLVRNCLPVYIYICMYVRTYVCMLYVCTYVCMYICVCVCVCTCMRGKSVGLILEKITYYTESRKKGTFYLH